jgi:hypothetical protein
MHRVSQSESYAEANWTHVANLKERLNGIQGVMKGDSPRQNQSSVVEKFPQREQGRARDKAAKMGGANLHYVSDAHMGLNPQQIHGHCNGNRKDHQHEYHQ